MVDGKLKIASALDGTLVIDNIINKNKQALVNKDLINNDIFIFWQPLSKYLPEESCEFSSINLFW